VVELQIVSFTYYRLRDLRSTLLPAIALPSQGIGVAPDCTRMPKPMQMLGYPTGSKLRASTQPTTSDRINAPHKRAIAII
jgi:hypothetical protein